MPNKDKVPDAWDDDWEAQADGGAPLEEPAQEPVALTRTERLARHEEAQRKLWEAADKPEEPQFLPVHDNVPLATTFKPTVKLLSRKPAPQVIAKRDPATGLEQLTLQDDDDEDDEAKKQQLSPEEIRLRQQKEREEKQRRYDEARAKIFGDSNPSSGASSPRTVTPPQQGEGRQNFRGRGRGRGAGGPPRVENRNDTPNRRPTTSQSGTGTSTGTTRELYDPNYAPKPGVSIQKRPVAQASAPQEEQAIRAPRGPDSSGRGGFAQASVPQEEQAIRAPRGPDSSGRGGFGFAKRRAKEG